MSLESQIMDQLKHAMRAKDEVALRTLRSIKAAILIEKTASTGAKEELSKADELKLLQKLAKQRKDSLEIFMQQNRLDLAKIEEDELKVIAHFLPEQLDDSELTVQIRLIIESLHATSPADMGKVMGAASKQLAGKADGKIIAEKVKELLSAL
jgi:uncharacterized protein YqeY